MAIETEEALNLAAEEADTTDMATTTFGSAYLEMATLLVMYMETETYLSTYMEMAKFAMEIETFAVLSS